MVEIRMRWVYRYRSPCEKLFNWPVVQNAGCDGRQRIASFAVPPLTSILLS